MYSHPVIQCPIEDLFAHGEGVFQTLANIVLVHLLSGSQCNSVAPNISPHSELVALHIRNQLRLNARSTAGSLSAISSVPAI